MSKLQKEYVDGARFNHRLVNTLAISVGGVVRMGSKAPDRAGRAKFSWGLSGERILRIFVHDWVRFVQKLLNVRFASGVALLNGII
jgi:hypothetical protein